MIKHILLSSQPFKRSRKLKELIYMGGVNLAGNQKFKIYGTLQCSAGKKMKIENRVFFQSAEEAINLGYRPCGNCLRLEYFKWKNK